jgi:hypothetical protein
MVHRCNGWRDSFIDWEEIEMRRIWLGVAVLGFSLLIGCGACRAQETTLEQEKERPVYGMDEMVVTATRTEREVKDVSTNVAVITRKPTREF